MLIPEDTEEMALSLNGKKSDLKRKDFDEFAKYLGINDKSRENIYEKFFSSRASLLEFVDQSFLSDELIEKYKKLVCERLSRIEEINP